MGSKFPSIRQFNSKYALKIEKEAEKARREFVGTLTKIPKFDIDKELKKMNVDEGLKRKIKVKFNDYLKRMKSIKK